MLYLEVQNKIVGFGRMEGVMRKIGVLLMLAILATAFEASAAAQYGKVLYYAPSGRYFELVKVTKADAPDRYIPDYTWLQADQAARQRVYKGIKGRLAAVDTQEVHTFILENLQPDQWTFIGLRYFCKVRKLLWTNGKSLERGQFQAWHPQWDQSAGAGCVNGGGEADWMSVAYTPANDGFRWVAKGAKKRYYAYIVEYPTNEK